MAHAQSLWARVASPRRGIRIRTLSVIAFIAAILAILLSLFETQRTMYNARALYELEQERQMCDHAIQSFMDGSDYLTNQVQQFVIKGERGWMDNYWTEVYETRSRDKAVDEILSAHITPQERDAATLGKSESDKLIQGEIWAMRMTCESVGIQEAQMPADVAQYSLTEPDANLSPEQKREEAIAYIFGPEYSMTKTAIRNHVNLFRNEITSRYAQEAITALEKTGKNAVLMSATLIVFLVVLIIVIISFMTQVVSPLSGFSSSFSRREGALSLSLPEKGALEIQQFAKAFNALSDHVDKNTKRLEKLGYVDYLTEVPNRASLTEYVSGVIAQNRAPLGLLMIDIDNFKKFNDTYGHALGDKVLRHVARAICDAQAQTEGISGRLCGEEFVVALPDTNQNTLADVARMILANVRAIAGDDVQMPEVRDFHITVSAGGALWTGEGLVSFESLLSRADQALYKSKCGGKNRYTFYEGDAGAHKG